MTRHPRPGVDHPHRIICERTHEDRTERVWLTVDEAHRALVVLSGRGTTEGAKVLIDMIDDMQSELGRDVTVTVLGDMRAVRGAPLRAQALLLRRLLAGRGQLGKAAFVITNPLEASVGRAILTMAGMGSQALLCRQVPEAVRFLGWPDSRYSG